MADVRHYDPDEVFDDGGLFERELAECTDPEHHHEYSRHHRHPAGQQRAAAPIKLEDGARANEFVNAITHDSAFSDGKDWDDIQAN